MRQGAVASVEGELLRVRRRVRTALDNEVPQALAASKVAAALAASRSPAGAPPVTPSRHLRHSDSGDE